jgi:predicted ferric reductase
MSTTAPAMRRAQKPAQRAVLSQDAREAMLLAAVAAGVLAVVGLWWADTSGGALHGLANQLTAIGRITGLVGTYLVLVQVVLMSRIPWLDRTVGPDRLSRWHRLNGAYSISLLVAHALFIIWGYAITDRVDPTGETVTMIRSYPDVLAATVGLLVLVAVGVISAREARRRLKYETWYFIHLYTYIAIALSFAHQLATGQDFTTHPLNRVLWIAMYLGVGALLLRHRVYAPIRNAWRHRLRVARVSHEADDAVSVYVTGRDLDLLDAEAGQFFRWRFLSKDAWWQAHPFSLSSAPNDRYLRITAKGLGDHTSALRRLRRGTPVIAEGPYGSFTARRRTRRKVLFIAGGVGITPLRALIEEMPAGPEDFVLIYRVTNEHDLILRDEIEGIARQKGMRVYYVLGPRDTSPGALEPNDIRRLVPDVADRDVFVCGPPGLMEKAARSLRRLGVRRSRIHKEAFEL